MVGRRFAFRFGVAVAALCGCAVESEVSSRFVDRDSSAEVGVAAQALSAPDTACSQADLDGRKYFFCTNDRSWSAAQTKCKGLGHDFNLVAIQSTGEKEFVRTHLATDAWIGGSDVVEGTWLWAQTNAQFWLGAAGGSSGGAYANWNTGQPNNTSNQDCALMDNDGLGKWSDESCTLSRDYVCEGDACGLDPNKTEPGQCGCGNPDTDSDDDGVADCLDGCDDDPEKASPGQCGCGFSDVDTDGDGSADCVDACDEDPVRSALPCSPDGSCTFATLGTSYYFFCGAYRDWSTAKEKCEAVDMHLARIDTAAENTFIDQRILTDRWIGGSDAAAEGSWRWDIGGDLFWQGGSNGTAFGYTNWRFAEPNNYANQDCLQIEGDGKWWDDTCGSAEQYICEATDACQLDLTKVQPGECGCGVPDIDTDLDGTADCNDECPLDSNNVVPGDCGCVGEPNLRPEGAACFDGPCAAATRCDGAGQCGPPEACAPEAGCVVEVFDGHAYAFCDSDVPWQTARDNCLTIPGMHLVRIDDADEDAFVSSHVSDTAWIGGTDAAAEGAWLWTDDGSQFWSGGPNGVPENDAYSNWQSGEPDNNAWPHSYEQDCALHKGDSVHSAHGCGFSDEPGWVSEKCGHGHGYVCEETPGDCLGFSCEDVDAECGSVIDSCARITQCGLCEVGEVCLDHKCETGGPQTPNTYEDCRPPYDDREICVADPDRFPEEQDDPNLVCPVPTGWPTDDITNPNQQLQPTLVTDPNTGKQVTDQVADNTTPSAEPGCDFRTCNEATPCSRTDHANQACETDTGTDIDDLVMQINQPLTGTGPGCEAIDGTVACPVDPATVDFTSSCLNPSGEPDDSLCSGGQECALVCEHLQCADGEFSYHCGSRYATCQAFAALPATLCEEVRECGDPEGVGNVDSPGFPAEAPPPSAGRANDCWRDSLFAPATCSQPAIANGFALPYTHGDDMDLVSREERCAMDVLGGIGESPNDVDPIFDATDLTAIPKVLGTMPGDEAGLFDPDSKWGMRYEPELIHEVALDPEPFGQDLFHIRSGGQWPVSAKVFGFTIPIIELAAWVELGQCGIHGELTAKLFQHEIDVLFDDDGDGTTFPAATPTSESSACKELYLALREARGLLKKSFFDAREVTRILRNPGTDAQVNRWVTDRAPPKALCIAHQERLGHDVADCDDPMTPSFVTTVANAWIDRYNEKVDDYLGILIEQSNALADLASAKQQVQIHGPSKTFVQQVARARVPIGPLNLLLEADATGSWGLDGQLGFEMAAGDLIAAPPASDIPDPRLVDDDPQKQPRLSTTFSLVPHLDASARAFIGVEIGNDLLGADIGIQGSLVLISLDTPLNAELALQRHSELDQRTPGQHFRPELLFEDGAALPEPCDPGNPTCTNGSNGQCVDVDPDPSTVAATCIYDEDFEDGYRFEPVLYSWELETNADARLLIETMSGQIDLRARVRLLLFKKTFKKKLADWTGYKEAFVLVGTALANPTNLDIPPVDPYAVLPDMGAFEMQVPFTRIEPLPDAPAELFTAFSDWGDTASPAEASRIHDMGDCDPTPF